MRKRQIKPYLDVPSDRAGMPAAAVKDRVRDFREVEAGFTGEEAVAEARRCLGCRGCLGCGLCAVVCRPGAIDFNQCNEEVELAVDEVVITPGALPSMPEPDERFGYGTHPDVLLGPELEQMLSPQGCFGGEALCPSNGDIPESVAFLVCAPRLPLSEEQLVRYRKRSLQYALDLAGAAKAKLPDARMEAVYPEMPNSGDTSHSLDMRLIATTQGKVLSVEGEQSGGGVVVEVEAGTRVTRAAFDMVVLCGGLTFSSSVAGWASRLGLPLEGTLFWPDGAAARPTDVPGVRLAGANLL